MYIHLYTTSTSEKELQIWWLEVPDKSLPLACDFERILQKYKEFGCIKTFTGEVFEVTNVKAFEEQLILMGVSASETTTVALQDGSTLTLNYATTYLVDQFNDLYSICFDSYDMTYAFSSDFSASRTDPTEPLIRVPILNKKIYTPKIKLDCIAYDTLLLESDNTLLNRWFSQFNKAPSAITYDSMCAILEQLYNRQVASVAVERSKSRFPTFKWLVTNSVEPAKSSEPQPESKSDAITWIEEFCNLYAEKDDISNTLLSEVYHQYLTASSWTNTETVNMSMFVKLIKTMSQFTIKRHAKGMVIAGYKFLVSQQEEFYNKMRNGNLYDRSVLTYIDATSIKCAYESEDLAKLYSPLNIKENYYFAAILLLSDTWQISVRNTFKKVSKTMLDQFINNVHLRVSIQKYGEYINQRLLESEQKITRIDDYGKGVLSPMDKYRKFADQVTIFFPFAKKLYKLEHTVCGTNLRDTDATPYDPDSCSYESYETFWVKPKSAETTGFWPPDAKDAKVEMEHPSNLLPKSTQ